MRFILLLFGCILMGCGESESSKAPATKTEPTAVAPPVGNEAKPAPAGKPSPAKTIWETIESLGPGELAGLEELFGYRLRRVPVEENPEFWVRLVNDEKRPMALRRQAMLAFFERHVGAGKNLEVLVKTPGVARWFEEGVLVARTLGPVPFETGEMAAAANAGAVLWPPDFRDYRNNVKTSYVEYRNWYTFYHPVLGVHESPNNRIYLRETRPPVRVGPGQFRQFTRFQYGRYPVYTAVRFLLSASVPAGELTELVRRKRAKVGTDDVWGAWRRWQNEIKGGRRMVLPDCLEAKQLRVLDLRVDHRREQTADPWGRLKELRAQEFLEADWRSGLMTNQLDERLRPGFQPPQWEAMKPWPDRKVDAAIPGIRWALFLGKHGASDVKGEYWSPDQVPNWKVQEVDWQRPEYAPVFLAPRKAAQPFAANALPEVLMKIQTSKSGSEEELDRFDDALDRLPVGEPPEFWLAVIRDKRKPLDLRRRCVAAFLRRHLRPGMTAQDVARLPWKDLALKQPARFHGAEWVREHGLWGSFHPESNWPTLDGGVTRCRMVVLLHDCVAFLSFAHGMVPMDLVAGMEQNAPWLKQQKLAGVHVYEPERREHFQMGLDWAFLRGEGNSMHAGRRFFGRRPEALPHDRYYLRAVGNEPFKPDPRPKTRPRGYDLRQTTLAGLDARRIRMPLHLNPPDGRIRGWTAPLNLNFDESAGGDRLLDQIANPPFNQPFGQTHFTILPRGRKTR